MNTLARRAWTPGDIPGEGVQQAQPAEDRPNATRIKFTFLRQNPSLSCPQGREQSRARKKQSTATEPKSVCTRGWSHQPAHQLPGPGAAQQLQGQTTASPLQRGCSAANSTQPKEGQRRRQIPSTHMRSKDRVSKEAGRGQLTQTPRTTILTSPSIGFPAQGQRAGGAWMPPVWPLKPVLSALPAGPKPTSS